MAPVIAFPYHDPDGRLFVHMQAILPVLKIHFERVHICLSPNTQRQAGITAWLSADDFFTILPLERELPAGEHFAYLYTHVAQVEQPETIVHLCYPDRVAFALQGEYRSQFLADIDSISPETLPLIFQRSARAWQTHPQNYARLEGFVTQVGQNLFGRALDYGWCHMVLTAGLLRQVMPKVTHPGISMVAEMVLHMQHYIRTQEVDWLAWEDPFIQGRDTAELKRERENSLEETEKRLAYVLAMVDALTRFARK